MTAPRYCGDENCGDFECITVCECGRGGSYPACRYRSCYECFTDRASDYLSCILCGRWHSPAFDTCFKCRPLTRGRDDPAAALRQLVLARDSYACKHCGLREGDQQFDPRQIRLKCLRSCTVKHIHRPKDDDGMRHATLQVDHIVPCHKGGTADEWNLQVLCGLHNKVKGANWYVGCRYEAVKTNLCRRYWLIHKMYFTPDVRERFRAEVMAFRETRTWDPTVHRSLAKQQGVSDGANTISQTGVLG